MLQSARLSEQLIERRLSGQTARSEAPSG
jgi:hypothetical protein